MRARSLETHIHTQSPASRPRAPADLDLTRRGRPDLHIAQRSCCHLRTHTLSHFKVSTQMICSPERCRQPSLNAALAALDRYSLSNGQMTAGTTQHRTFHPTWDDPRGERTGALQRSPGTSLSSSTCRCARGAQGMAGTCSAPSLDTDLLGGASEGATTVPLGAS